MSYLQEQIDIETFFQANWTETPIVFENGVSLESNEWVRLTVLSGVAKRVTMGDDPAFRHSGVVFVQIYTALDEGAARAKALADAVENLFREALVGTIRFGVPQVRRGPVSEWYQINVSTDFRRGF